MLFKYLPLVFTKPLSQFPFQLINVVLIVVVIDYRHSTRNKEKKNIQQIMQEENGKKYESNYQFSSFPQFLMIHIYVCMSVLRIDSDKKKKMKGTIFISCE